MIRAALFIILAVCAMAQERKEDPPPAYTQITVTATPEEPGTDRRQSEVFTRTLFSRDDQVFHVLEAGINAGQHEGGGKSVEIRRFGFNLDHGGVNGGLKVLVDNVQQNQSTQGHGQGYLGALKTLTPELIQEVTLIDGPFSAEYGDFSGLGVVHIKLRDSLPDVLTLRLQGGSFGSSRGFFGYSPQLDGAEAFAAYEFSRSDGPFINPLAYKRDVWTGHYGKTVSPRDKAGIRVNMGRNDFDSSGQLPLDEVAAGRLDRFGFIDPTDGGRSDSYTGSAYWTRANENGSTWKADGFVSRSLFDLYSNFTFFLNDLMRGDGIQQHDSRLQEGANLQYTRPYRIGGVQTVFTAGANYHDNQIKVGLYSRENRVPLDTTTLAHAHVTNGAGYVQESASLFGGALLIGGGLRFDQFRFGIRDAIDPAASGVEPAGRWQPKASIAWTPAKSAGVKLFANYGRGISTSDARGIIQHPELQRVATTDFFQTGASYRTGRLTATANGFLIDRSNEMVYVPDDGSFEFKGPSRAYGYETKLTAHLTRHIELSGGITKVGNAFYRATAPRIYVDSAPHFVGNADLTVAAWKGWSGSLRLRAINHYRLDGEDASIIASGHTVVDFGMSRQIRRGIEFNFSVDNLTNRAYYETQNYFESRLRGEDARFRIHGTPGYPRTIMAGLTFRLFGK